MKGGNSLFSLPREEEGEEKEEGAGGGFAPLHQRAASRNWVGVLRVGLAMPSCAALCCLDWACRGLASLTLYGPRSRERQVHACPSLVFSLLSPSYLPWEESGSLVGVPQPTAPTWDAVAGQRSFPRRQGRTPYLASNSPSTGSLPPRLPSSWSSPVDGASRVSQASAWCPVRPSTSWIPPALRRRDARNRQETRSRLFVPKTLLLAVRIP